MYVGGKYHSAILPVSMQLHSQSSRATSRDIDAVKARMTLKVAASPVSRRAPLQPSCPLRVTPNAMGVLSSI